MEKCEMDLFDFIVEKSTEGQKHCSTSPPMVDTCKPYKGSLQWLCFTTLDNIVYYKVLYIDNIVESSNKKKVLYREIYVPALRERFKSEDPISAVYDAVEAIRVYVKGITKTKHINTFVTLAWKGETNKEIRELL